MSYSMYQLDDNKKRECTYSQLLQPENYYRSHLQSLHERTTDISSEIHASFIRERAFSISSNVELRRKVSKEKGSIIELIEESGNSRTMEPLKTGNHK